MRSILIIFFLVFAGAISAQSNLKIAFLKYSGGGDYYANPTSLPNLAKFCNKNLQTNFNKETPYVEVGAPELFDFPFVHMTGHGNVIFSPSEAENLRNYLRGGGFLHIDDNYGMDKFIRDEIKKVFPNNEFVELPVDHPIYKQKYKFPKGLPKIHEHDDKDPQAFGIIENGRLLCLYTFETDLGDGWEDQSVHNDPNEKRQEALKMGANIIQYAFNR
jgi:hypothetical protein